MCGLLQFFSPAPKSNNPAAAKRAPAHHPLVPLRPRALPQAELYTLNDLHSAELDDESASAVLQALGALSPSDDEGLSVVRWSRQQPTCVG